MFSNKRPRSPSSILTDEQFVRKERLMLTDEADDRVHCGPSKERVAPSGRAAHIRCFSKPRVDVNRLQCTDRGLDFEIGQQTQHGWSMKYCNAESTPQRLESDFRLKLVRLFDD